MTDMNVDWKKTALLVIDMQNDFILPGGPMYIPMGASVVPAIKEAVAFAREKGALVVWVVREHDKYGRDVELFRRHLYGEGKEKPTTKGTKGADLVEGLVIQEGDYKLVKTRFSAFFATNLHSLLQGAGITSVVVVGVQTPNCIRQTVFDAVALDYYPVIVLSDATAAKTPEVHAGMPFKKHTSKYFSITFALDYYPVIVLSDATAAKTPEVHTANLIDMCNVGVQTPTLYAWSGKDVQ